MALMAAMVWPEHLEPVLEAVGVAVEMLVVAAVQSAQIKEEVEEVVLGCQGVDLPLTGGT